VRHYALSHLTNDSLYEVTLNRHCEFYLGLVQEQEKALEGAAQFNAIQVLGKEMDNLRAVMSSPLSQKKPECLLRIAVGLGQFWLTQGYWREGLEWLEQGLGGLGPILDVTRAKALTLAGWLSRYLGDYPRAIAMLQEGLALWRQIGDLTGLALTLCNLGASVLRQGDIASATGMLEEALSLAQQQDDRFGTYFSLEILGHAASRQGNSQRSVELYKQALVLARQTDDENQIAKLMASTGYEYVLLGDYDRAEDWFTQAEPICQRLSNRMIATFITANRGFIAMKKGNYPWAFDLLAESILVLQELGDKEEAISYFEPMALIAKELGFPDRAARLLGASESLHKSIGVIRSQPLQKDYNLYIASVHNQLGEPAFKAAWAEGSKMTYEQALAYAVAKL
jgi:tetratricopeptide (TPR) repeat protein